MSGAVPTARWGLIEDALIRLHADHLLYDRGGNGEFLHAYTVPKRAME